MAYDHSLQVSFKLGLSYFQLEAFMRVRPLTVGERGYYLFSR